MSEHSQRIIQESVPGKQITLAHIVANIESQVFKKLGIIDNKINALGILTITPSEASIIAADVALKSADVHLSVVDRFCGSLVISGDISSVESALVNVMNTLRDILDFTVTDITRT